MCIRRKKLIFHVEFRMKSVKCIAIGTFNTSQGRATVPGYVRTILMLFVYTDNADFQFMLSQAIINIF